MSLNYESAERFFAAGEFAQLTKCTDCSDAGMRHLSNEHRLLVAQALALTGDLAQASRIIQSIGEDKLTPLIQTHICIVRGTIAEAAGSASEAFGHFQAALRFARLTNDVHQVAWAQLRLFRHLIDTDTTQGAAGMLLEARRAATRSGTPQNVAYLHLCVAVLEGQTGRLDEARRHCDIVDALLREAPNALIKASNLVNRVCLAILGCRFSDAVTLIAETKRFVDRVGLARSKAIIESNLGQVQFVTGQFSKAALSFARVRASRAPGYAVLGASEGLARMHLALDQLHECEEALQEIDSAVRLDSRLADTYHARWASITKARLFLKSARPERAVYLLTSLEPDLATHDLHFRCALHVTLAQSLAMLGNWADATRHIIEAQRMRISTLRELQGQYYFAAASLVGDQLDALQAQLRERAVRLWRHQGVASLSREMSFGRESVAEPGLVDEPYRSSSPECLLESAAAVLELGHSPRLLGDELLRLIERARCAKTATLLDDLEPQDRRPPPGVTWIDLTKSGDNRLVLECTVADSPRHAVLVGAIVRLAEASTELESYREVERNRAALWPAEPLEEQAGALFVAEEMRSLLATAQRIAGTNVPVLITGETGTGKEVLARTIHAYSTRAKRPFLPFNCTSTPRDMLDSQLFGHRRGSFTGATEHFQGIIRAAAAGTLFLDEIGDMPLDVQPKLLRFLESGEVHPVGETQPVHVEVRIIAATNANLDALVTDGRFREDLFYRLNIVRLHIPALRERRVEIPALANHYLQKHAKECGKGDLRLAEETMEYLVLYRWPGNVRQLANEMRRMAVLCEAGAVLMPEHLSPAIAASRRTIPASERTLDRYEVVVRLDQPMAAATEHLERTMVQYALDRTGGRVEEAAALLGLSRKGLYLKRQRFGIEPPGAAASIGAA